MIIITLAVFATPVNAATWDNQWFIDSAIAGVETEQGISDRSWSGSVTTGWHYNPPGKWHKHVALDGTYGYKNTGKTYWDGRVYWDGTICTFTYLDTPPISPWDTKPTLNLKTTIKNPQYRLIWDGKYWVENTPTIITIDGRTWVIYSKP